MGRVLHRFRPRGEWVWRELFRMTDDWEFIPDDGQPGLAFAGKWINPESGNWFPMAVGYQLRAGTDEAPSWVVHPDTDDGFWGGHPNSIAMNAAMQFCLDHYNGVANGKRVR